MVHCFTGGDHIKGHHRAFAGNFLGDLGNLVTIISTIVAQPLDLVMEPASFIIALTAIKA